MLAQDVLCKIGTCKAIEVADTSANGTLLVEVVFAVTLRSDVLIQGTFPLAAVKFAQDIHLAKLTQMSIETAFAR